MTQAPLSASSGLSRRAMLGLAGAALACEAQAQDAAPATGLPALRMALVPYLSPRVLMALYVPLRSHLESQLNRRVDFLGASGFRALAEGARQGNPPFTQLPIHLAQLAVADWGQTLLARTRGETPVTLVGLRERSAGGVAALRGRRIATIDPISATSLMLRRWLVAERLDGEVEVVHSPNVNSAAIELQRGEVAAIALVGPAADLGGVVRPEDVVTLASLGGLMACIVAHASASPQDQETLQRALLSFPGLGAPDPAAQSFFVKGSRSDLVQFEPLAADARRLLAAPVPAR